MRARGLGHICPPLPTRPGEPGSRCSWLGRRPRRPGGGLPRVGRPVTAPGPNSESGGGSAVQRPDACRCVGPGRAPVVSGRVRGLGPPACSRRLAITNRVRGREDRVRGREDHVRGREDLFYGACSHSKSRGSGPQAAHSSQGSGPQAARGSRRSITARRGSVARPCAEEIPGDERIAIRRGA